jgi:probable F420-dependent oxidoreductase
VVDLQPMGHPRRFRFAVELHEPFADRSWNDTVREVESLGYSTMFVPDHFDEGLGPIAAMASAVAVTTTLRVGTLVLDCDFRHPAVLARELATIDRLSEGRLEVGLGAGWKNLDYQRSGIAMERPGVRVDRLIEHTTVLRGLFAPGPFTFAGEHYQIAELDGSPAPHHHGGPPILIGGGAKRVLRFAGATADIIGLNASVHSGEIDGDAALDAMAERIDEKLQWVKEGAGDRFDDIEINAWLSVAELTDDPDGVSALVAELFGVDAAQVQASPLVMIGTVDSLHDVLHQRRERWGYSYHVIPGAKAREFAPLVAALTGR